MWSGFELYPRWVPLIPDCFDFIVSILVVKLRKTDCQSISESVLFLFHEQPKLSIFECGAEHRFDFHNNFWLILLLHVSMQQEQARVVYHIRTSEEGIWDLHVRLINISKK